MSPKRKATNKRFHNLSHVILVCGMILVMAGLLLSVCIFWPVLVNEFAYQIQQKNVLPSSSVKTIRPIDTMFGIVIPKINANAKIIPNVDPYDSRVYQEALTRGVAHAKGSVYPGRVGNMFIFSHSSVDFFQALRYNSVFYLLDKLETNDEIDVYFNSEKFVYRVTEKKLVDANAITYLTEKTDNKLVTLMTCWPPGTTFKRLIVRGILQEQ